MREYLGWLYCFELILGVPCRISFRILASIDSPLLSHEGLGVMPHYIEKTRNCCYILTSLGTDNLRTKQHNHPTFIVFQLLLCCKIWLALILGSHQESFKELSDMMHLGMIRQLRLLKTDVMFLNFALLSTLFAVEAMVASSFSWEEELGQSTFLETPVLLRSILLSQRYHSTSPLTN